MTSTIVLKYVGRYLQILSTLSVLLCFICVFFPVWIWVSLAPQNKVLVAWGSDYKTSISKSPSFSLVCPLLLPPSFRPSVQVTWTPACESADSRPACAQVVCLHHPWTACASLCFHTESRGLFWSPLPLPIFHPAQLCRLLHHPSIIPARLPQGPLLAEVLPVPPLLTPRLRFQFPRPPRSTWTGCIH